MNTLTINGKLIGECLHPREYEHDGKSYEIFLMKEGYHIAIENGDVSEFYAERHYDMPVDDNMKSSDFNYIFNLKYL